MINFRNSNMLKMLIQPAAPKIDATAGVAPRTPVVIGEQEATDETKATKDVGGDNVDVKVAEEEYNKALEEATQKAINHIKEDYANSDANSAQSITQRVMARIQNALNYIQYAKDNNIDIFDDNTGTGVEDKDGELQKYTDGNGKKKITSNTPGVKSSKANSDGSYTNTYSDGHTATWNENSLELADDGKTSDGTKWESTYDYNEDGSFTDNVNYGDGRKDKVAYDKNYNAIGSFRITAKGNYKAQAKQGETFMATLTRLGITNAEDIKAVAKANPKAFANKYFRVDVNDVYIPKEVIANMKANGTYDEDKLMGKI